MCCREDVLMADAASRGGSVPARGFGVNRADGMQQDASTSKRIKIPKTNSRVHYIKQVISKTGCSRRQKTQNTTRRAVADRMDEKTVLCTEISPTRASGERTLGETLEA